ncbi:MAG: alanine racemase [Coriobacteriales bacterium]|jgi:alanine racemase|nr:alanine racemase [Coriobacteriales bacterium]
MEPSHRHAAATTDLVASDRRWAWVEINREAIRHNLKRFRRHLGPDVRIMAIVKADAYGHGAEEVARIALTTGATCLGVASVDEGVRLRLAGIGAPILVLTEPPIQAIELLLHHQLIPAVYNRAFALALGEMADANGRPAPFHLKIDTGMNRVGIHHSDAADFLRQISFHRGLELQGTFTHFATADEVDTYEFGRQLERFSVALETIRYMGMNPGIVHAANTSAALRYRQAHFDMVRVGIGMYGLYPSRAAQGLIELHPAMSVHARVNCLKAVPMGEGVSYSFTYRSPGNVQIATIPLGYGDGLSRVLSNHMEVLCKGRRLPQVGTICMDMTMFEINQRQSLKTPRVDVQLGDEVVIVGNSGQERIALDDLARSLGTINYELACRFGLRLERVYTE